MKNLKVANILKVFDDGFAVGLCDKKCLFPFDGKLIVLHGGQTDGHRVEGRRKLVKDIANRLEYGA